MKENKLKKIHPLTLSAMVSKVPRTNKQTAPTQLEGKNIYYNIYAEKIRIGLWFWIWIWFCFINPIIPSDCL